tara:strand:+ start:418 stop:951 length:534 start_codon:yes stop_codon:yes gene_type:complete
MKWSAAMLGLALLLGLVGMSAGAAIAQGAPPNPPARYAGTVTVDGTAAAAGASVQAWVGGAVCATTAVNAAGTYVVDVSASCGGAGTTVAFSVDGALATETAAWSNSALNVTNLTVTTPVEEPAAEEPAAEEPAAETPAAPATGSGLATTSSTQAMLLALLGLTLLSGTAVVTARKR